MSKISVIGAGAWGTAIAKLLADKYQDRNQIYLWGREVEKFKDEQPIDIIDIIQGKRENKKYLPGVWLPSTLKITPLLSEAVDDADIVVSAVPSEFLISITEAYKKYIKEGVIVVSLTKGIDYDEKTGQFKRMSEILQEVLGVPYENIVALSGPNFAIEIALGMSSATVVAGTSIDKVNLIRELFNFPPVLKVYKPKICEDIIGVELGGALKNIYAIAGGICGHCDEWGHKGYNIGDNSQAALFPRCLEEMCRFGERFGADRGTFYGESGLGDLALCFYSSKSRNHQVGYLNSKGLSLEDIKTVIRGVAEGIRTVKSVYQYAEQHGTDLNIARQIYLRLYEQKPLEACIRDLFRETEVE